jgi:hypothetical protein
MTRRCVRSAAAASSASIVAPLHTGPLAVRTGTRLRNSPRRQAFRAASCTNWTREAMSSLA